MEIKLKQKNIVVAGSAANPPTLAHREIVKTLLGTKISGGKQFDEVIWVPSGVRMDKKNDVGPFHRMFMTEINLSNLSQRLTIDYGDIFTQTTPTIVYLEKIKSINPAANIMFATGSDVVFPREVLSGKSEMESWWVRGTELLSNWPLLIFNRPGFRIPEQVAGMSNVHILESRIPNVSSTEVRESIAGGNGLNGRLHKGVEKYIEDKGLYGVGLIASVK